MPKRRLFLGMLSSLVMILSLGVMFPRGIAESPSDGRAPIPGAERQTMLKHQLREGLKLDEATTSTRRQQALRQMMKLVEDPDIQTDEFYVVIQSALPIIHEKNDIASLRTVVTRLAESFAVDAELESSRMYMEFLAETKSRSAFDAAFKEQVLVLERLARRNDYREVGKLLDKAEEQVQRFASKPSVALLEKTRIWLEERETAHRAYLKAVLVLEETPDDPRAKHEVGFWTAIYQSDWGKALPLLASGNNVEWSAAAKAELRQIEDNVTPLTIADLWWELGQKSQATAKSVIQDRALTWYEGIDPDDLTPVLRTRAIRRQTELAAALKRPIISGKKPKAPAPGFPPLVVPPSKPGEVVAATRLPTNTPINLLTMIDLPEHVIFGKWSRQGTDLVVEPGQCARVMTPIALKGSYDLTFRFTRRNRVEAVTLMLPLDRTFFNLLLDSGAGQYSGLERFDRKFLFGHQEAGAVRWHKHPEVVNDIPHTLKVNVTVNGDDAAIVARLDQDELVNWKGPQRKLISPPYSTMPNTHAIGVLAYATHLTVHELTLELKPDAEGYRLGKDWKNPLMKVADGPEEGSPYQRSAKEFNGRPYYISNVMMELPDAQKLAILLKGRLVTISSPEENEFVRTLGQSERVWISGWSTMSRQWRDERNRPLRYPGAWMSKQPDNLQDAEGGQQFLIFSTREGEGWDDTHARTLGRACIEWGEEDLAPPTKK
jgi:hypothetical protein